MKTKPGVLVKEASVIESHRRIVLVIALLDLLRAKFHYAVQLASWSATSSRAGSGNGTVYWRALDRMTELIRTTLSVNKFRYLYDKIQKRTTIII